MAVSYTHLDVYKRQATGRKPNSVRNYYYTVLCRQSPAEAASVARFTPFTPSEMEQLLRDVLCAQAEGGSVRACALQLAEGDRAKICLLYTSRCV